MVLCIDGCSSENYAGIARVSPIPKPPHLLEAAGSHLTCVAPPGTTEADGRWSSYGLTWRCFVVSSSQDEPAAPILAAYTLQQLPIGASVTEIFSGVPRCCLPGNSLG
mmetsp:Transcript_15260/g.33460  ORF Transcript_15260/g.33460 Transcript_15260/m.33460 type:complete len:108 (-) Transcript_15260:154-477(-)